jgi:predicted RecB family endonuclease
MRQIIMQTRQARDDTCLPGIDASFGMQAFVRQLMSTNCHCEERSDEAIMVIKDISAIGKFRETASARSASQ